MSVEVPERTTGPELAELLRRTSQGDADAYAALYDATAPLVFGITLRIVRAESLAEEVCQEVFTDVWRLAPRFDPTRGSARSWIAVIAHRRAVDHVRSEQAHRERTAYVGARDLRTDYDEVAEAVETRVEHARVRAALSSLPAASREAIEQAYYGARTYREVAERLDVPVGTIKTRIRSGLRELARSMHERTERGDGA